MSYSILHFGKTKENRSAVISRTYCKRNEQKLVPRISDELDKDRMLAFIKKPPGFPGGFCYDNFYIVCTA